MGKQILVSPEVLRKSAQGLAAAKEELTYLIEALEQVQTALPGCWESPNTQRYMEKLERVLQSARRNCNSLEDIRKELSTRILLKKQIVKRIVQIQKTAT